MAQVHIPSVPPTRRKFVAGPTGGWKGFVLENARGEFWYFHEDFDPRRLSVTNPDVDHYLATGYWAEVDDRLNVEEGL